MKFYLEKAILVNRAPFEKIELDFNENEIAILSAVNGKGKTTILSHLVDAFYEMARPHFSNEFEGKENKFYRVSSAIYNLDQTKPSFVYFRFRAESEIIDYVDIRNTCTEDEYNKAVVLEDKIPFAQIQSELERESNIKKLSSAFDRDKAENIFWNNLLTYFPAYRFEMPGYLNDPYKVKLNFKKESGFAGDLKNPLEVVSGLPRLMNWMMDIILDMQYSTSDVVIVKQNLDKLITYTLISKKLGNLRLGVGPRGFGSSRIQVVKSDSSGSVYPSIFNLSAGEAAIFALFGELIRQADNNKNNILLNDVTGIVLIDEIDKHLHIKLQKEILPKLFNLFPNVQFIVSSHSPFLSMGLAEESIERSKIIDLDNLGISKDPTKNELYTEVYNMMIDENDRFKEMYQALEQKISEGGNPLVITEGKTDISHIKKAKENLNIQDLEIDYFIPPEGEWGESKLKLLLEQVSKLPQSRKIIGIFDRDISQTVSDIESNGQLFKDYGNNVYAFCIPIPEGREQYSNISIEFYYKDNEIKKANNNKSLYFDNEVDYLQNKSTNKLEIRKLDSLRIDSENSKKIFDVPKMCEVADWIHSKSKFADLVENDLDFTSGFDFSKFSLIFDKIKLII